MVPPLQFGTPDLAATSSIVIAPFLFLGLWDNRRNLQAIPIHIDCDKSQMSGRDVLRHIGEVVLNKYFHSYFHRRLKNSVH